MAKTTRMVFAIAVALLMVSSIAAAGPFDFMANLFYNKVEPAVNTATNNNDAAQRCTANADCGTGTCTSCRCIAANMHTGTQLRGQDNPADVQSEQQDLQTQPDSKVLTDVKPAPKTTLIIQNTATNTKTGLLIPDLTAKAIAINIPSAEKQLADSTPNAEVTPLTTDKKLAEEEVQEITPSDASQEDSTGYNPCMTACRARCRTDCSAAAGTGGAVSGGASGSTGDSLNSGSAAGTTANGQSCTTNANCASGYCQATAGTTTAIVTRRCAPCTLNTQCGTGKVCIIPRADAGVCMAPQNIGGPCNENADCASNNCANKVTMGSTVLGQCAAVAAKIPLTLTSGLKLSPITGQAITIQNLQTIQPATNLKASTNLANGAVCTSASQCTSRICSATTANKVCSAACKANTDCETGKTCSSGRCVAASTQKSIGATCGVNNECASGYCNMNTKVCAAAPANANQNTAGDSNANIGSAGVDSAANNIGDCVSTCEANCETTCGKGIANGANCNNPAHCENQCASGAYECFCEGTAVKAAEQTLSKQEDTGILA
ncbi:MAG: hypothetical protein PHO02_06815, partial [Candidatus Nanoarchaeia archaeon]|nr:hypothetical protein [Candidatus Nanoarchaeia archaeon]